MEAKTILLRFLGTFYFSQGRYANHQLNRALDLKEALEIGDLEDADKEQDAGLEQRPPHNARVCALGSYNDRYVTTSTRMGGVGQSFL